MLGLSFHFGRAVFRFHCWLIYSKSRRFPSLQKAQHAVLKKTLLFMAHIFQNMKLFNNSSNYTSERNFLWDGRFVFFIPFLFWYQCWQKLFFQWIHVSLFCLLEHILSPVLTAYRLQHFVLISTAERNSFQIIPEERKESQHAHTFILMGLRGSKEPKPEPSMYDSYCCGTANMECLPAAIKFGANSIYALKHSWELERQTEQWLRFTSASSAKQNQKVKKQAVRSSLKNTKYCRKLTTGNGVLICYCQHQHNHNYTVNYFHHYAYTVQAQSAYF